MRLLLIVNTAASSVTARRRVVIQKALSAEHDVRLKETNRRGHAARLAQGAAADGVDVVVVLGGDGTLNEAANGLAGTQAALAVLPGGSTNVFARTIGMANDPLDATTQLLRALADGLIAPVGLGEANGRYFLFHAGVGFDAAVVSRVERFASLKRYTGALVFVASTLATWGWGFDRQEPAFDVSVGDESLGGCFFTVFSNTDPYTYLGRRPLHVAPSATLARALSIVGFQRLDLATMVPTAASAFGDGHKVGCLPGTWARADVKEATLTAPRPVPYQLDGDYLGEAGRLDLRWEEQALLLVTPPVRPLAPPG